MPGILYLVATPIGNLQDMSLRAIDVLRQVDVIACEDTRHSRKLLNHFSITNKLVSYHEHNEAERSVELISMIASGKSVAVISDAGTPGISDPGFLLVQRAREAGAAVVPIPGPVAFVCRSDSIRIADRFDLLWRLFTIETRRKAAAACRSRRYSRDTCPLRSSTSPAQIACRLPRSSRRSKSSGRSRTDKTPRRDRHR